MSVERSIAERLVRNRMRERMNEAEVLPAPRKYYKQVEDILNNRLGNYERGVKVTDLKILDETPGTITFKVEYTVEVRIPVIDPEDPDGGLYYEDDLEYRTQTLTIDTEELDEDVDYDDIQSKVEKIAKEDHGNIRSLTMMPSQVQGYDIYRCIGPDNKGKWYATKDGNIIPITYAQARGEEDINPTGVSKLRRELTKKLMPKSVDEDLTLDDDPEETEQKYSSAATSINSAKLPALFNMVDFEEGSINLDYGGGRFDNVAEYLDSEYGATNLVYDKYNRSADHNREVLNKVRQNGGADTVTCSNVLNVIAEESERLAVLRNCKRFLKSGGTCYITVYEGNGTGEGAETKAGYQLNRKTKDYEDEIKQVFSTVTRKGKLFICR